MRHFEVIAWEDACDSEPDNLEEFAKGLPLVETVGEVIYEDETKVVLRHHRLIEEEGRLDAEQCYESIVIPVVLIHSRRVLHEKA